MWRTMLITVSTCFLLGTIFSHWIADHNVLWKSPLTLEALEISVSYYSLLASAPPWLAWAYLLVGIIALTSAGGRLWKVWQGQRGEILFDGGSIVLLLSLTYTQLAEVLPNITSIPATLPHDLRKHPGWPMLATAARDLANDNIMCAVMLTGVMLLQAGRYYVKRPDRPEIIPLDGPPSPIAARASTPFRELTEAEALELK